MIELANWTPRPAPKPVRLEGRYVDVVPYERTAHAQALWTALGGDKVNALLTYFAAPDFVSSTEFADWLDQVAKSGWLTEIFIDKQTGAVVGMANYMRADPANGVVEVGGVAHGPAMAGTRLSTEAHYLMAAHIFDDLDYRRYEWKCHNENAPSKRSAERYGFAFEGIFRQHMLSRGKNRDTAWYSMIDSEWPLIKKAFEAWLEPGNFDAAGQQIKTLPAIRAELLAGA
jgi:RimJ/RimL family protein N-acetyltransferase